MANTICGGSVQACATRFARLNSNGSRAIGPNNTYVTDALITFQFDPELSTGDDFEQENACGSPCITYKDCDRLKRLNLTMDVCTTDPELTEIIIGDGGVLLRDLGGNSRGFGMAHVGEPTCPYGVSVEIWSKHIVDGDQDPNFPWIRWVLPRTKWQIGARAIGNDVMTHPFTGQASESTLWGSGPGGSWPYVSDRLAQWAFDTEANLPATACGYQTVLGGS